MLSSLNLFQVSAPSHTEEFKQNPTIASLTFGQMRDLHSKDIPRIIFKVDQHCSSSCYQRSLCPPGRIILSWKENQDMTAGIGFVVTVILCHPLELPVTDMLVDMGRGILALWTSGLPPFVMGDDPNCHQSWWAKPKLHCVPGPKVSFLQFISYYLCSGHIEGTDSLAKFCVVGLSIS